MSKEAKEEKLEFPQDNQKPYALFKDKGGARMTTYDNDGNSVHGFSEPSIVAFPILKGEHAISQIKTLINEKGYIYLKKHNIAETDKSREKVKAYLDKL